MTTQLPHISKRKRIIIGLILSFLITIMLGNLVFVDQSPAISFYRLTTLLNSLRFQTQPSISINSRVTNSPNQLSPSSSLTAIIYLSPTSSEATHAVTPTHSIVSPTTTPANNPTATRTPTPKPTQKPSGSTLCRLSPTYIPDWGPDAPYAEICVYDTNGHEVKMQQLCRAVCKNDNCTESICYNNASYGKFNRGGHHSAYDGYGIKISKTTQGGKQATIINVTPNVQGRLTTCITISGHCYLWDFWNSGARSISITVRF